MIRSPEGEAQDLEQVFNQYFSNQQGAQIAVLLAANDEMTVDGLIKCVAPFRNNTKKTEWVAKTFDYTHHRLRSMEGEADEVREMGSGPESAFISRFREDFVGRLEGLGEPTKHLLKTGIQEEFTNLLFDLKSEMLGNGEMAFAQSKTEYLKQLIEVLVSKFYKDNEDGVAEKIIAYGGIEPVLTTSNFASDIAFKNKFRNILYNCKTFSELKKYGGKDIVEEKRKLTESISNCLITLKFNEVTAQAICNELLEKPLSNIVALRDDLTNKQKEKYYSSEFYKKGELKAYAQIRDYEKSLEFKVKEDITKILNDIDERAKNSKETIECVLNFNLYGLLKLNSIKHIKKEVYQGIIANCPDFLRAFKMVKYQGRAPASLRDNEYSNQKMELIDVFFKSKLPYEEWEVAERKILSREYNFVDELTLKFEAKHKLVEHIVQKVEPYFHRQEKEMEYSQEVEHDLLQKLMDTVIGENTPMDTITTIIAETLEGPKYRSEEITNLNKKEQKCYDDVVDKKSTLFKEYKANKGRDVKEEQYKLSWQLKEQIYENNLEDKVSASYDAIDEFIQKVVVNGGSIPKAYPQFITDLNKLRGDPIPPPVDDPVPDPQQPEESTEELNKKLAEAADRLLKAYIDANEDSVLENVYTNKYGKNSGNLIKSVVEKKAFQDQNSAFFTEAGLNGLLTKRLKGEFVKNLALASPGLEECSEILRKLGSAGSSGAAGSAPPEVSSPVKKESSGPSEAALKTAADAVVKKYIAENEDSLFEKALNEKFAKDNVKFLKTLIEEKAFEDPNSAFFGTLGLNGLLTKRIKGEFAKNSGWALEIIRGIK